MKQNQNWVKAKQRCRLSQEDIRMAMELGLNPLSLIKNIPSQNQQWKMPVKQRIRKLYRQKRGKTPEKQHRDTFNIKSNLDTPNAPAPLHLYANETALIENRDNPLDQIMAAWEEYIDEFVDNTKPQWLQPPRAQ